MEHIAPSKSDMTQDKIRFVFVDALRGIAALLVLLHHLCHNTVMNATFAKSFPAALFWLCGYGAHGVEIFFVLSGFVIAHSVYDFVPTPKEVGGFILRRQLRLDPSYWAMLLFILVEQHIEALVPSFQTSAFPGLKSVVINALYLHNLTGINAILGVSWTLCIEVQFYLLFVFLLGSGRVLSRSASAVPKSAIVMVVALALISLARYHYASDGPWFITFWFYFAIGVLCYWAVRGRIRPWTFATFPMLCAISAIVHLKPDALLTGAITATLLYMAGHRAQLGNWLKNPMLQYFGRISYSLYLVHVLVLSIVLRGGYKLTGTNAKYAWGWFVLAALASILAADVFHRFIERPTTKMASRLKHRPIVVPDVESHYEREFQVA
jgi:peptidoglycan/LPS O-acetylase OafA/YrhL